MKPFLFSFLLLAPLHAQVVPGAFEPFTDLGTSDGWGFRNFNSTTDFAAISPLPDDATNNDGDNGEIFGQFTGTDLEPLLASSVISLFADSFSSSQYFIGDYASARIETIVTAVYFEDPGFGSLTEFYFVSDGTTYFSDDFIFTLSGWFTMSVSLSEDQWFIIDDTQNVFVPVELSDTILSTVSEVGVNFIPSATTIANSYVALDNFTILPDLTPPSLDITTPNGEISVSFEQSAGISYDLQMSPTLQADDWVSVDPDIRGEGPFETSVTPLLKSFFRVATSPLFFEAP